MEDVPQDDNIDVKSYQDHLGYPLVVYDKVGLWDRIVVSCDYHNLLDHDLEMLNPSDSVNIFGTCALNTSDSTQSTAGWLWHDHNGNVVNNFKEKSKSLCGKLKLLDKMPCKMLSNIRRLT